MACLVTQNTQLKDQPKLFESAKDPRLVLGTIVRVETTVDVLSEITGKAEFISAQLMDESGTNISRLAPSIKRVFEDISEQGKKAVNPKKRKTCDLSSEISSPSVPVKAECMSISLRNEPGVNIKNLPPEVIQHIAKFSDVDSVNSLACTSKHMNYELNNNSLWNYIYHRETRQLLEHIERKMQSRVFKRGMRLWIPLILLKDRIKSNLNNLLYRRPLNWKKLYKSENNGYEAICRNYHHL